MTRREKAECYTDGEGLKPLSWGRLKIAQKAFDDIPDEDGPDVAAALYLMEFQALRKIPRGGFLAACQEFAQEIPAHEVIACGQALQRDLEAAGLSMVEPADSGKQEDSGEAPSPSEKPASLQRRSA